MLFFRSLLFNVVFYVNTAVFLIFGSWLLLTPRTWAIVGLRAYVDTCLWWMRLICGTHMEVRGRENLPDRPFLIAAKHQSTWDTLALIPVFEDPVFVLKAELMKIPLYGWFIRKFGMISIQRETGPAALRSMLREARLRLQDQREILVFPEGTRKPADAPPDYKPGILMMYEKLQVPCVPVALNSGLFWPRHSQIRHPGTIIIEILPVIPPGLKRKDFSECLQQAIETATTALCCETRAERAQKPNSLAKTKKNKIRT